MIEIKSKLTDPTLGDTSILINDTVIPTTSSARLVSDSVVLYTRDGTNKIILNYDIVTVDGTSFTDNQSFCVALNKIVNFSSGGSGGGGHY